MLSAFTNSLKIPELRSRIFYTLALLFVARVGASIPLPGINPLPLQEFFRQQGGGVGGAVVGLYSMFTGGALLKGAVCSLGIMPYISASIIFQLMTAVVPTLSRLQQEGDVGRQKLTQYTRYATVLICLIQGTLTLLALENPSKLFSGYDVATYGSIVLPKQARRFLAQSGGLPDCGHDAHDVARRADHPARDRQRRVAPDHGRNPCDSPERGEPDLPILLPARCSAPTAGTACSLARPRDPSLLRRVTMGIIMRVVQGQRKIPVQYAKRVVGNKVMGGQSSFLPLKVNYSGVMPVIFASAILLFPQQVMQQLGAIFNVRVLTEFAAFLVRGHWVYYIGNAFLILFFSYFWVSVMFKPIQIADDLKKYGGYIPGVRPGEPTAQFLDFIMTRLTLAGALFLTIIAVAARTYFSTSSTSPSGSPISSAAPGC